MGVRLHCEQSIYVVWRSRKDEGEEVTSSFSSSSFDVVTTTTTTNTAQVDNAEVPTKDGFKEEATDKTARGNGIFHERRTEEVE